MTIRTRLNLAALAVIVGGALLHDAPLGAAAAASVDSAHACCPQAGATCYMNLDGAIIVSPDMRPC